MGVSGKELEDQLRDVGKKLLSPPSAVELRRILLQTESLLSKVDQSPTKAMLDSLCPAMNALIRKELQGCLDVDMQVVVLSCISELIRITAPDGPYDDDVMKEVFRKIVETFEKLDDMSSQSYPRRIAILDTVAKIKACVMMVDIECDDLILEMFRHFISKIRPTHAYSVFSSMEAIMTVVLQESEEISHDLISCLLDTVNLENKKILPVARELGDKVIRNCEKELKPYIKDFFQSKYTSLRKYNAIVRNICKKKTFASDLNEVNGSVEAVRDDSRQSDRTESDDLPLESVKLEGEVQCQEGAVGTAERSTKPSMSNALTQVVDAESCRSSIRVQSSGQKKLKITSKAEAGSCKISTVSDAETTPDTNRTKLAKLPVSSQKEPLDNGDLEIKSQSQSSKKGSADQAHKKKRKSASNIGEKLNLKQDGSSSISTQNSPKDLGNLEETPTTAGTKQDPLAKEISNKRYNKNKLDSSLVGAQVLIWWPNDERYYEGVVESYDVYSKKHTILYNDGDIEVLQLSKESWLLVDSVNKVDLGSLKGMTSPDTTPNEPHLKKIKVTSSSLLKAANEESPLKSGKGTGSAGRHLPTHQGRQLKVVDSIHGHSPGDHDATFSKLKERSTSRPSVSGKEPKMADASEVKDDMLKADTLIVKTANDSKDNHSKPAGKPNGETFKADDSNRGTKDVLKAQLIEDNSAPGRNSNVTSVPKPVSELKVNGDFGKFKIKVPEANLASKYQPDTTKAEQEVTAERSPRHYRDAQ